MFVKMFQDLLQSHLDSEDLVWEARDPLETLELITRLIRKAGKMARDSISQVDPSGSMARGNFLAAVSRGVWHDDSSFAHLLLHLRPGASHTISIDKLSGRVLLVSPSVFVEQFRCLRDKKEFSVSKMPFAPQIPFRAEASWIPPVCRTTINRNFLTCKLGPNFVLFNILHALFLGYYLMVKFTRTFPSRTGCSAKLGPPPSPNAG